MTKDERELCEEMAESLRRIAAALDRLAGVSEKTVLGWPG